MLKLAGGLILLLAAVLSGTAASAAGLLSITSGVLGSDDGVVAAPPVEVVNVEYDLDWEDGVGNVVDGVTVNFVTTDSLNDRLGFYIALSGDPPYPVERNGAEEFDVGAGFTFAITGTFESADLPAELLTGIHILVCSDEDGAPANVCTDVSP